jgi:hypothetical protein
LATQFVVAARADAPLSRGQPRAPKKLSIESKTNGCGNSFRDPPVNKMKVGVNDFATPVVAIVTLVGVLVKRDLDSYHTDKLPKSPAFPRAPKLSHGSKRLEGYAWGRKMESNK